MYIGWMGGAICNTKHDMEMLTVDKIILLVEIYKEVKIIELIAQLILEVSKTKFNLTTNLLR